jgi:uncharacterized lipoprotein YmbA
MSRRNSVTAMAMAMVIASCASAPTRYYNLAARDPAGAALNCQAMEIVLDSITVPALVDRMQLVVEQSDTQVRLLQHERWAVPLRDQIASILTSDLRAALRTDSGAGAPLSAGRAQPLHLSIDIDRLEAGPKALALIEARWRLRGGNTNSPVAWSATVRQPLADESPDTIVRAWSEALRNLGSQVVESICTQPSASH